MSESLAVTSEPNGDLAVTVLRVGVPVLVHACHYVRMSARMHLSPAHHAHPRSPGEEQFALAAELLALLSDRTRLLPVMERPARPPDAPVSPRAARA